MKTVLVCGGRGYENASRVEEILNHAQLCYGEELLVVQGGARGADRLAETWASYRGVKCVTVPAPWSSHGKAAGTLRNRWMLEIFDVDAVIAFP